MENIIKQELKQIINEQEQGVTKQRIFYGPVSINTSLINSLMRRGYNCYILVDGLIEPFKLKGTRTSHYTFDRKQTYVFLNDDEFKKVNEKSEKIAKIIELKKEQISKLNELLSIVIAEFETPGLSINKLKY
jgi:uncharacterized membrane-anchored protein